jgi:F-box protein 21
MTASTIQACQQPLSAWSDLPDEVLQHVLFFVSPNDLLFNVQCISRRFSRLASEPLLWRHHCQVNFTYWDSKHRIRQKFLGNVGDVDWKTLYKHRKMVESETAAVLDSIIDGQVNRIQKFKMIADFGYDAKDTLLKHCRTPETADDVLARRQAI